MIAMTTKSSTSVKPARRPGNGDAAIKKLQKREHEERMKARQTKAGSHDTTEWWKRKPAQPPKANPAKNPTELPDYRQE
jgi:hypothetical protein